MGLRAIADRTSTGFDDSDHVSASATPTETDPASIDWNDLESVTISPTQHLVWARSCLEVFHESDQPQTTVVRRHGRAIAIAPLIRTSRPVPRLKQAGVAGLFEPTDFLYRDEAALDELADQLAQQPSPLFLERLPFGSAVPAALQRAFKGRGLVRVTSSSPCPYIELDASWCNPEQTFNSGRRSDFRRARRHAERLGAVTFEVHSPRPHEVGVLLEEAIAVENSSWKGAQGTAMARDPARGAFFRRYSIAAAANGILRMAFMRIAGKAVAMQLAVECHGRFWLLKIGYDERVGRASPGQLLMLHTLKYAADRNLESFEFLGCVAPWTDVWTTKLRACTSVRAYPFSAPGMLALAVDGGRYLRQRLEKARKDGG